MAISKMTKVLIISHRSEANDLLEAIQHAGICEIFSAEQAIVSKDSPDLCCAGLSPRDVEDKVESLGNVIDFLSSFSKSPKGITAALAPRAVIEQSQYNSAIVNGKLAEIASDAEQVKHRIDALQTQIETYDFTLKHLKPWESLDIAVEQLGQLENANCLAGIIAAAKLDQIKPELNALDAIVEPVSKSNNKIACVIICLKENSAELHKLLRSIEFESANFESMAGTIADILEKTRAELLTAEKAIIEEKTKASEFAGNLLELQILFDHNNNLLSREQTQAMAPATDHTVIFEGWTKKTDYAKLEKIVSQFNASSLNKIEPVEDEDVPVEIENSRAIKPFEVVTRLYGMPQHIEIDPTILLAPFFAIFFALCLTDAGYGIIIILFSAYLIKKMQADKKLLWLLVTCSVVTIGAGALTGGWLGDTIQQFIPGLSNLRKSMMWFDPLEKPMTFFALSCGLGYFHIMFGICTAFVHNLMKKDYAAAVFDCLTWLVMLNSLVLFGTSKMAPNLIRPEVGSFFGIVAMVPAALIFLFSQREGSWGARLGMGAYNLFSTIFYLGDVLSYLRLMALGMVTGGLAMAINVIAKIVSEIPYGIGIALAIVVFIGGHLFNVAISGLSAFVHTIRLQFVEFFPKFLVGGGREFKPLGKKYQHIYLK